MSTWTDDELRRIGAAEELEIAPVRRTVNADEHRTNTLRLVPAPPRRLV